MVEKEARKSQLNGVGHNHSRDSAIDADLQEWETESHEIEIVCSSMKLKILDLLQCSEFFKLICIFPVKKSFSMKTPYSDISTTQ